MDKWCLKPLTSIYTLTSTCWKLVVPVPCGAIQCRKCIAPTGTMQHTVMENDPTQKVAYHISGLRSPWIPQICHFSVENDEKPGDFIRFRYPMFKICDYMSSLYILQHLYTCDYICVTSIIHINTYNIHMCFIQIIVKHAFKLQNRYPLAI